MAATITRDEIKARLDAGVAITLVETLGAQHFEQAHLPGAINIYYEDVDEQAPALLPDKDALIVTYCSNTACRFSGAAQAKLERLGYTNVVKYAEGKDDWVAAGLPVEAGAPVA